MSLTGTVATWGRRVLRWTVRAAALFVVASVLQVFAVRFVNPPFTLTMVERAWEAGRWPERRHVRLGATGHVARAFVSSEDGRFFLHHGFDWEAVCAAFEHNATSDRVRGGSTISQQVAKNVFLWQGRSWLRKGLEVWYTGLLELLVPKTRILELYLDVAETGPLVFGAEAGARHHFGTSAGALSLDQAGRLAGILPDPRNRSVKGESASRRAAFVKANLAPFPGDPGYDEVKRRWDADSHGPWVCLGRR
ncbi:MAG: monofunctional biosynthetic peptidoglycan transglycosylase [Alphaproteobacteria bacterium]|nr:monofunctional biosynthetic peptidoglycan transglycosylase [Alphaproteobacteria bacterium]